MTEALTSCSQCRLTSRARRWMLQWCLVNLWSCTARVMQSLHPPCPGSKMAALSLGSLVWRCQQMVVCLRYSSSYNHNKAKRQLEGLTWILRGPFYWWPCLLLLVFAKTLFLCLQTGRSAGCMCRIQEDIPVKPQTLLAKQRRTITSMCGVSRSCVTVMHLDWPEEIQSDVRQNRNKKLFVSRFWSFSAAHHHYLSITSTNACSVTASFWRPFAITVSPSIRGSEEASPLTVVEGSLITLMCESSGIPPPSLAWTKDGKRVSALIKRGDAARKQKLYMCGWRAGTPHLSCVLFIFQVLKWNLTSGSGFCQEVDSCRSPALRRQMLLLTPAQPPVQLAPSPRSTACRFMVCKHHEFIHFCL